MKYKKIIINNENHRKNNREKSYKNYGNHKHANDKNNNYNGVKGQVKTGKLMDRQIKFKIQMRAGSLW